MTTLTPSQIEGRTTGTGHDSFEAFSNREILELCGSEAQAWLNEFRQRWSIAESCFEGLALLRQHELGAGRRRLERALAGIDRLQGGCPSVRHFLYRWYFAAAAYDQYCRQDLERAEEFLLKAHESVCDAISTHGFLIPFAVHCVDFRFQRARIARRRRQWPHVRAHLDSVRRMWAGEAPFCHLRDGRSVTLHEIRAFYSSLPLSGEQRRRVRHVLDPDHHFDSLQRTEEQIYVLPDFVIPYP